MTPESSLDEAANGMTPVDPALIEVDEWLNVCGSCDAGLPVACSCPTTDPRPVITRLLAALDEARAEVGELRLSRAELADECESLRSWVADGKAREMERIADAVARVTPCSCSTQRARAEAAESSLEAVQALVGSGGPRSATAGSPYSTGRWDAFAEVRAALDAETEDGVFGDPDIHARLTRAALNRARAAMEVRNAEA